MKWFKSWFWSSIIDGGRFELLLIVSELSANCQKSWFCALIWQRRKSWIFKPKRLMEVCDGFTKKLDFGTHEFDDKVSNLQCGNYGFLSPTDCWKCVMLASRRFHEKKNGFSRRRLDENALKKLVKMRQSGKKTILPRF